MVQAHGMAAINSQALVGPSELLGNDDATKR